MPWCLKRYYGTGSLHFITWSCYRREPLLETPARRDLLLNVLEQMRIRYRFAVIGYVVMPEHVHLLISEPLIANPSTVVQAVKLGFSRRLLARSSSDMSHQIWQRRFYDFNLWSQRKEIEKLKYMHRNPVVRGLVESPDRWRWSSYRSYCVSRTRSGSYQRLVLVEREDSRESLVRIASKRDQGAPFLARLLREKWGDFHASRNGIRLESIFQIPPDWS